MGRLGGVSRRCRVDAGLPGRRGGLRGGVGFGGLRRGDRPGAGRSGWPCGGEFGGFCPVSRWRARHCVTLPVQRGL